MKTLQIELPDQLAGEVEKAVQGGWFKSADELVLHALRDFVAGRRFALMEQQQLDDVAWASRFVIATGEDGLPVRTENGVITSRQVKEIESQSRSLT